MTRNYKLDFEIARRTEPLTKRDVRALTQGHKIANGGGDGEFVVESSSSGNRYDVDLRRGACDCPDADGDGGTICKHSRAVQFATGMRPIPPVALRLDEIAVDVIRDGSNDIVDLDAVDDYAQIRLETDASVNRRPCWATEDGEIVDTAQADSEAEPADITAERALVEEQAATDGGATCGAETGDGSPCRNPIREADDHCHLHRDAAIKSSSDSVKATQSAALATADVATDGGQSAVEIETADEDVIDRVLERAGDRPIIIVVN